MHSCVKKRNLLNQKSSELNVSNEASSTRWGRSLELFFGHGRAGNLMHDYLVSLVRWEYMKHGETS